MKKIISVIAAGAVFCLSLAGCAGAAGVLAVDTEDNVITITSENSDGTEATGNLTVGENDYVIFSPDFTDGSVDVKFIADTGFEESSLQTPENAQAAFEGSYSGRVLSNEVIAPGDYYVSVNAHKADGTMIITTADKDEFEKQNEDFKKELEKIQDGMKNGQN